MRNANFCTTYSCTNTLYVSNLLIFSGLQNEQRRFAWCFARSFLDTIRNV